MSETSTIKEFLVALGFKVDEGALQKFDKGIQQATKSVTTFALAIDVAVVGAVIGINRWAQSLEALYFASLRTNTSAANFRAFSRALQDVGGSAGDASSSIEGVARFLRNNPGGGILLNGLFAQVGRSAFDASGHILDTTALLENFAALFKHNTATGNGFLNSQYADRFGISEKTMLGMQSPEWDKDLAAAKARAARADLHLATTRAHALEVQYRRLQDNLFVFGTRIVGALESKFKLSLGYINTWFEANGDKWADRIAGFLSRVWDDLNRFLQWVETHGPEIEKNLGQMWDGFLKVYGPVKDALTWVFDKFMALNEATDGWALKLATMLVVLKALGATSIIGGISALAASFVSLGAALLTMLHGAPAVAPGAPAVATIAEGEAGLLAGVLGPILGALGSIGGGVALGWGINKLFPDGPLAHIGNMIGDFVRENTGEGRRLHAVDTLENLGMSGQMATSIVKVMLSENENLDTSARGDGGTAVGVMQWHPERQAAFEKIYGHKLEYATLDEQLKFAATEPDEGSREALMRMRDMDNEPDMIDTFVRMAERPANPEQEIERASQMHIQQEVTIHVNAADNPMLTAAAIRQEIQRSNQEMFRNFKPPVL